MSTKGLSIQEQIAPFFFFVCLFSIHFILHKILVMNGPTHNGFSFSIALFLLFGPFLSIRCQDDVDTASPLATSLVSDQLGNFRTIFADDIKNTLGFCIKDVDADWDQAFDFNDDVEFIGKCIKQIKGDITQRICTAAEIKLYFNSFRDTQSAKDHILKPNNNCNLKSWIPGCEPGWSAAANVKVNLKNTSHIPGRTRDSQPCCEGFFCPEGITCMIPCPLGSYCPLAKLNETTGICDPFGYQLPPGKINHTCGGADTWSSFSTNKELFCAAGSYCPTTTRKETCGTGHYCQLGSTIETCLYIGNRTKADDSHFGAKNSYNCLTNFLIENGSF